MNNHYENYKGFDIHQNAESKEVAILIDTPDGSFRQKCDRTITSIEEAKQVIDTNGFNKN